MAALVGTVALLAGATLITCALRLRSFVSFVLAVYLVAWGELVLVVVGLSLGRWLTRWTLLAALGVAALVGLAVWLACGRPRPPSARTAARHALDAAADPLVAIPLALSAAALVYTLVVGLTTAPNDGDPLVYELTRAAFWRQHHGITNLHAAYDERIDYSPPVAETGNLAVLVLTASERYVALTQWLAVFALALGTYGVGRRIGLDRRPALWGAALVPTFPVVLTQTWSAFTDIVFASFAVSGVYFGIGGLGFELVPFGLSIALGLGTKFLGPIFAPLLALIVGLAQPVRKWPQLVGVALAGTGVAGVWFLRTQLAAGDPAGNGGVGLQPHAPAPILTTLHRLTVDVFDISGGFGANRWLYLFAAFSIVFVAIARIPWHRRIDWTLFLAAGLVALTPALVTVVGEAWAATGVDVWTAAGRADLVDQLRNWRPPAISDAAYSWFGPIGVILLLGGIPVALIEARRRELSRTALALGAAPLIALTLVSITIAYQRFEGRYVIAAFALCTASVGAFALRHRWVGAALVAIAATGVVLALVNALGRPTGVRLLAQDPGRSIWSMPHWEQQGLLHSTLLERDETLTMRFVENHVPATASIGIALVGNNFSFPYFGHDLSRRVTIVDKGEVLPHDVDWVVVAPERIVAGCAGAWTRIHRGTYGWSVWRRVAPDSCTSPTTLGSG
jgi:hypothetical protein